MAERTTDPGDRRRGHGGLDVGHGEQRAGRHHECVDDERDVLEDRVVVHVLGDVYKRQAVSPSEMERAAVLARMLIEEAELGRDGWWMGDGGPLLEGGVERALCKGAQNGVRVAEGSGDMLMQPEWRMIAMDAPVSRCCGNRSEHCS